jgi:ubiquinone/menaquinone biosynthesis C-methylase UbiE
MRIRRIALAAVVLVLSLPATCPAFQPADAGAAYVFDTPTRDGIGKRFFGREIAKVMGHRGAAWLERKSRVSEELPDRVVQGMNLSPDDIVADIGAGTGYFTFRIANRVPSGKVYAVDVQPEMLAILRERMRQRSIGNVVPVQGEPADPRLPDASVDAVLLVDAYHEFAYPLEMMRAIVRALRPSGRVFLVEYRGEDPRIPIKPLHKMTQAQAIVELEAAGLRWVQTGDFLPTQHFMIFERSDQGPARDLREDTPGDPVSGPDRRDAVLRSPG